MARPIKRLQAEPNVIAELPRRSRSTTFGVRDRERANIILLRIEGLGELQAAINRLLGETNANPRPFRWTKDPDKIIADVKRGHQSLDSIH
jgi:hypothetical protein